MMHGKDPKGVNVAIAMLTKVCDTLLTFESGFLDIAPLACLCTGLTNTVVSLDCLGDLMWQFDQGRP